MSIDSFTAGAIVAQMNDLIQEFVKGNDTAAHTRIELVADPADLDARDLLASPGGVVGDVRIPRPPHAPDHLWSGIATYDAAPSVVLHVLGGGTSVAPVAGLFLGLAARAGRLYQQLPHDTFPQHVSTHARSLWIARVYGMLRGGHWVLRDGTQGYDRIVCPFLASAEVMKVYRDRLAAAAAPPSAAAGIPAWVVKHLGGPAGKLVHALWGKAEVPLAAVWKEVWGKGKAKSGTAHTAVTRANRAFSHLPPEVTATFHIGWLTKDDGTEWLRLTVAHERDGQK